MAEHTVSNERRKELEHIDPFQEALFKAMAYAKEYKKQLILILGAVVAVVVIFSGIMYSFQKAEDRAAVMVSHALIKYAGLNDPDKGFLAVKDDFEAIFSEYANTSAGRIAKVKFAKICYDAAKFDQSYAYYTQALEIFEDQALMKNFLLASLGHVCLARKEFEQAKTYFLKIEKGKTDLLKDEARYTLAMLYDTDGNAAESQKMYEKIVMDYDSSMYTPIAKSKIDKIK